MLTSHSALTHLLHMQSWVFVHPHKTYKNVMKKKCSQRIHAPQRTSPFYFNSLVIFLLPPASGQKLECKRHHLKVLRIEKYLINVPKPQGRREWYALCGLQPPTKQWGCLWLQILLWIIRGSSILNLTKSAVKMVLCFLDDGTMIKRSEWGSQLRKSQYLDSMTVQKKKISWHSKVAEISSSWLTNLLTVQKIANFSTC